MITVKEKIRQLIGESKTDEAIQILLIYGRKQDWENTIIAQSAKFNKYQKDLNNTNLTIISCTYLLYLRDGKSCKSCGKRVFERS